MKIRTNLSGLVSNTGKRLNTAPPSNKQQVGKVYGVITTENTPTKELFEKYGGWNSIGTIFYLDYNQSLLIDKVDLNTCKVAKPSQGNTQNYPLVGELVNLTDGPSPISQLSSLGFSKYYTGVINTWNNSQQNSLSGDFLGKSFIENSDLRPLILFEGDIIHQGRKGNGIRFGSTNKYNANLNEWSSGPGNDGDPVTILVNGYITADKSANAPNVEEVNKEMSSIYMTSTQKIPLLPDRNDNLNPITSPILPNNYINGSQIILNSDRITLNSKKDEVMIFAKTNVEISTNNIINLNAGKHIHLNSPTVLLGTKKDGTPPTEPVLLGNKTISLLTDLMAVLSELGRDLVSVVAPPQGAPIMELNTTGVNLTKKIEALQKQLNNISSEITYTA